MSQKPGPTQRQSSWVLLCTLHLAYVSAQSQWLPFSDAARDTISNLGLLHKQSATSSATNSTTYRELRVNMNLLSRKRTAVIPTLEIMERKLIIKQQSTFMNSSLLPAFRCQKEAQPQRIITIIPSPCAVGDEAIAKLTAHPHLTLT